MINTWLHAIRTSDGKIVLDNKDGETVASFVSDAVFYIVTGFKDVNAFNAHQDDQPVKFLLWKREH